MSDENQFEQVNTTILEDWGMMMVEPISRDENPFQSDSEVYVSMIQYSGKSSGRYRVFCQKDFMEMLAENLLGVMDEVSEGEREDALKEMANVVCGNLLTSIYGTEHVFDLTPPTFQKAGNDFLSNLPNETTCQFLADDCPVLVTLEEQP